MTTPAVECIGLEKTYRLGFLANRKVLALRGVSFTVNPGEVFGLIGPNGAGKSTTIKILLNLVLNDRGHARMFGVDVSNPASRRGLGFVPESPVPYEYLSAREYVSLQYELAQLPPADRHAEVERVLARVELGDAAALPIRRYSKGMVQRAMLAGALIGRPRVVILDEPTSGLDPLGRRLVSDIILDLRRSGVAVLFCTHLLSDVESLCDRVALLVSGSIRKEGTMASLLSGAQRSHEIMVEPASAELPAEVSGLCESSERVGQHVLLRVADERLQAALAKLIGAGVKVLRVQPLRVSLEATFLEAMKGAPTRVGGELE
ncbi:MAG: ABC transporter ATP-binding protein [Myxococcota bacterium]